MPGLGTLINIAAILAGSAVGAAVGLAGGNAPPDKHWMMLLAGITAANPQLNLHDALTPLGVEIIEGS